MLRTLFYIISLFSASLIMGQGMVISADPTATPAAGAALELQGTAAGVPVGGMLIPRMTEAQRNALTATAVEGLWVYQTDNHKGFYIYSGTRWTRSSYTQNVKGKANVNPSTGLLLGTSGSGFTITQNATDNGIFDVNYSAGTFNATPTVTLTPVALEPVTIITPAIYCYPTFSAGCNTFGAADYLDDVRLQSCPTGGGSCNYGPDGFEDLNTGCDNPSDNYQDNFFDPTLAGTVYGPNFNASAFFNLRLRSSWEWKDNLFAYIDWNQDGDFSDAQEVLVEFYFPSSAPSTQGAPNGGNFSLDEEIGNGAGYDASNNPNPLFVPAFAANGATVLRVMSRWSAFLPDPCINTTFGETHDYKVTVVGGDPGASTGPRGSICTLGNSTASGFRVYCTDLNNNRVGTSFHFYAAEN